MKLAVLVALRLCEVLELIKLPAESGVIGKPGDDDVILVAIGHGEGEPAGLAGRESAVPGNVCSLRMTSVVLG
jgi:hypothetical protein